MKVKCLNCGHEFETTEIEEDNLGQYCICEECGASFDVDVDEIVEGKWKPHLIGVGSYMALISSSVLFKVHGGKYVHNQKVSLRPMEHHYEKDGELENIKYSCQLWTDLRT